MLDEYDPDRDPDPEEWRRRSELERIDLVEQYHLDAEIELPSTAAHAAIHAAVETQIADPETPVRATLERLTSQGLSRHEAIHAIGSVLAGRMWEMLREDSPAPGDPNEDYYRELSELTAASWLEPRREPSSPPGSRPWPRPRRRSR